MVTALKITVLTGPHKDQRFCFRGSARCTVGRANDCFVRLAGAARDLSISRHHCQLNIDPPCVLVQDLGSLNGTYLNGKKLDPLEPDLKNTMASLMQKPAVEEGGNIVIVGGTTLRMDIVECPPPGTANEESVWNEGEIAKRDCQISC